MIRVNVFVEGQTEEGFVKNVLACPRFDAWMEGLEALGPLDP